MKGAGINLMPPCMIRQWGDMTGCIKPDCGLRWDTNDSNPPVCPSYAVAVQRRKVGEVSQAQQRLSALYSEPAWPLRRILDVGGKWALGLALVAAAVCLAAGEFFGTIVVLDFLFGR